MAGSGRFKTDRPTNIEIVFVAQLYVQRKSTGLRYGSKLLQTVLIPFPERFAATAARLNTSRFLSAIRMCTLTPRARR